MKDFILFLTLTCGGGSFVFSTAAKQMADGSDWAVQMCKISSSLCHGPQYLAFAAAGLAALWLLVTFVLAIRN